MRAFFDSPVNVEVTIDASGESNNDDKELNINPPILAG